MGFERNRRTANDHVELAVEPLGVRADQLLDRGVGRNSPAHLAKAPRPLHESALARQPQVYLDQVARVGSSLRDQRPAFLGHQGIVLRGARSVPSRRS